MPFFLPEYDSLHIHAMMLSDSARTETYQRAIEASVRPGDVVIDVGSGTGILAMFAARAGARKVYSIEPTGMIELAKRIAKRNGLAERIEFIQAKVEEVELPEKADCLVSEWLGVFALEENLLPCIAHARDHLLKPGGQLLPQEVGLFLALVEREELHEERIGRWRRQPYGLDYTDFAAAQANDVQISWFAVSDLVSRASQVARIDMRSALTSRLHLEARLSACRDATCHGLVGWFRAEFPGGLALDTGPGQPWTHWEHAFFPLEEPLAITAGDELAVQLDAEPEAPVVNFSWQVKRASLDWPARAGDTRRARFAGR